ncbi:MAG: sensor histidine kinase [Flavobacteriales bacterium]|nr:sensor histidine kinase [Flavobacteriales bacterium]
MSKLRLLVTLILMAVACTRMHASVVGDSLRYVLDADASLVDRAKALVKMAERTMEHDPANALAHAMNALRFAEQSGDQATEHDAVSVQREVQLRMGMYAEYLRSTMRALELAQALSDAARIGSDLRALSIAYRMNGRMDRAVEEARNALAAITPTNDKEAVQEAERFLMHTLLQAGRFDEVLRNGERALSRCNAPADSTEKARIRVMMARTLLAQKKYNDALPYLTMAERVLAKEGTADERFTLAIDRAEAALGIDHITEARDHLEDAQALFPYANTLENRSLLMQQRYLLEFAEGAWKEALDELRRLRAFDDSTKAANLDLTLAGMQVMYELDRKDKDNHDLRDQNSRNEAVIAEQRISNRYLLVATGIFLALAVALFLISRNSLRNARRSRLKNSVIERQKDEIHAKNMELQRQNMRLAETLVSEEQKDIVIKEIHHRVKNNLQVIDSLLNMQCGGLQDPATARMLKEAQGRIRAMSLVHGSIFRSGGEEAIPVRNHLQELARHVLAAHGKHDSVSVLVDVAEIGLTAQDLMPLSLLVNELLTNAIKYAFPHRESGQVRIVLRPNGAGYELLFSDDGDGHAANTTYLRQGSFGMQLIEALAQQLNGEVRILKGSGTAVSLSFFPEGTAQRKAS